MEFAVSGYSLYTVNIVTTTTSRYIYVAKIVMVFQTVLEPFLPVIPNDSKLGNSIKIIIKNYLFVRMQYIFRLYARKYLFFLPHTK